MTITKKKFTFYKTINSGYVLLSPPPAPLSPPDPSYQEQVPPLNSTSKGLTIAATPVVPMQRRAQLDQLRNGEKPQSLEVERLGAPPPWSGQEVG